jgi:hypothetical protein
VIRLTGVGIRSPHNGRYRTDDARHQEKNQAVSKHSRVRLPSFVKFQIFPPELPRRHFKGVTRRRLPWRAPKNWRAKHIPENKRLSNRISVDARLGAKSKTNLVGGQLFEECASRIYQLYDSFSPWRVPRRIPRSASRRDVKWRWTRHVANNRLSCYKY